MRWIIKQKNILDEPADALICSANVHLTLSGGVGADLLARHGPAMQAALQEILRKRESHFAQRGEVFPYIGAEVPYKVIIHAVAIDGWYQSAPQVITQVVRKSLQQAAEKGARKVTLAALATGFGRLSFAEFAAGIRPLLGVTFSPITEVVICLLLDFEVAELRRQLPEAEFAPDSPKPR
jgi:O-acetyl-ADP-ribose deacetylase (regulator of RNase III)